jgi:O-antigen/teichoic acid export membrane protein
MSVVKKNILANFVGNFWSSIIGFIFIPIYIHFIGVESYGILGIFTTIQAVLSLMDMGLSGTTSREIAKHKNDTDKHRFLINFIFSIERIYFCLSIVMVTVLVFLSYFFANKWVNSQQLNPDTICYSFMLMALNFGVIFSSNMYLGGMSGFQKQVISNTIISGVSTLKAIGAIFVLYFISPTIIYFLIWQLLMSIVQLILLKINLWKIANPNKLIPEWNKEIIYNTRKYSLGLLTTSVLVIILTQCDKIILSKMVSLKEFGYYTLAFTLSNMLGLIVMPISSAVFPKFVELIAINNSKDLSILFHKTCQLISFILIPIGFGLFIYSEDLILFWTKNQEIAENSGKIFKYLALGTVFNNLMIIPYQYTLAKGWVRFGINITIVAIIFFLPFILFAAYKYGAYGSAIAWMVLNFFYLIFAISYLFSRELRNEKYQWYIYDILSPLSICAIIGLLFFFFKLNFISNIYLSLLSFILFILICFISLFYFSTPLVKSTIEEWIANYRLKQKNNL